MKHKQVLLNKYDFEFIINGIETSVSLAEKEMDDSKIGSDSSVRKLVETELELMRKLLAYLKPQYEALKKESL